MTIALLHLSDIHLRAVDNNPILQRAHTIADAVSTICVQCTHCIIVVSGDSAFSGLTEEFSLAHQLLDAIHSRLSTHHGYTRPIDFCVVPGNHDCDFTRGDQLRAQSLAGLSPSVLTDKSIITKGTSVQHAYFDYQSTLMNLDASVDGFGSTMFTHIIRTADCVLAFHLFNTAWCSQLHETQGQLVLPVPPNSTSEASAAAKYSIAVLHHPFNWLEAANARSVRSAIETCADIILTGHEHESDSYKQSGSSGYSTLTIEGGVLQDSKHPDKSAFNLVLIDHSESSVIIHKYTWIPQIQQYMCMTPPSVSTIRRTNALNSNSISFSESFLRDLNDIGASFTHPRKDPLLLSDVFQFPDCQEHNARTTSTAVVIGSRDIVGFVERHRRIVITSPERSGKTSFAKCLAIELQARGQCPLFLNLTEHAGVTLDGLQFVLDAEIERQYGRGKTAAFWKQSKTSRTIVIDDIHLFTHSRAVRDKVISALENLFDGVVVLGPDELRYEELTERGAGQSPTWAYRQLSILPFGELLRFRLIQRWYLCGRDESSDATVVNEQILRAERVVTSLLGRDLVPPYPLLILTMLQSIEANIGLDVNQGSFGHVYSALITLRMAQQAGEHTPLDAKLAYLAEFAFFLYETKQSGVSWAQSREWHEAYCNSRLINIDHERLTNDLIKKGMLEARADRIGFKYRYNFFFFVARHIARNIHKEHFRSSIRELSSKLYNENAANIMLFVCYMSSDPVIINSAVQSANSLFANFPECRMSDDVRILDELATEIPQFVLPANRPEQNYLQMLEESDKQTAEAGPSRSVHSATDIDLSDAPPEKQIADVNASSKTVQILGQILRNFAGSLDADDKLRIAESCYRLSLRTLGFFVEVFRQNKDGMLEDFAAMIRDREQSITSDALQSKVRQRVFAIMEILCLSTIRHSANSMGMQVLTPVFRKAIDVASSDAAGMIDLAIKLDHDREFPRNEIERLYASFRDSGFLVTMLRMLVYCHFYLFPTNRDTRSSVCSFIGIKVEDEKLLDPRVKRVGSTRSFNRYKRRPRRK